MNQILIAGHLGADPEVRFTSGGQKVTTLRVACNSRKSGKDETIWWKVTAWGEQFDKLISYLKKGSPLMVSGELPKPEIFTDREGKPQISMNITANNIMFSPFGKSEGHSPRIQILIKEVKQSKSLIQIMDLHLVTLKVRSQLI